MYYDIFRAIEHARDGYYYIYKASSKSAVKYYISLDKEPYNEEDTIVISGLKDGIVRECVYGIIDEYDKVIDELRLELKSMEDYYE